MPHDSRSKSDKAMPRLCCVSLLTISILAAPAWAQVQPPQPQAPPPPPRTVYAVSGETCDGWPRAQIGMAPGFCAGIVVAPPADFNARTIRVPRTVLPLPGGKDFLVTDVGRWQAPGGALFRITAERGQPTVITPLLTDLYMPHAMLRGPDGKVYVNEQGRIFRFDPLAADPKTTVETVIADARYVGDRFGGITIPSFTVVDASARFVLSESLGLTLKVDNLTDELYVSSNYYEETWIVARPRQLSLVMDFSF